MNQEETIKEIVLARLGAMPNNVSVSFGVALTEVLNKEEMIKRVQQGDAIGNEIIGIQMNFLTSLKNFSRFVI